jgi:hypothetical protein
MKDLVTTQFTKERRALVPAFVFMVLLCCLVAGSMICLGGLRRGVENDIEQNALPHTDPEDESLHRRIGEQQVRRKQLLRDWEQLRARTDTFKGSSPLTHAVSTEDDARIDFKVALFEARGELHERAAAQGIMLPSDLGLDETIGAEEDAETRLWQLASVVRLMETCIDVGVPSIDSIEALPPRDFPLPESEGTIAKELPVKITMRCSTDVLADFLISVSGGGAFFALRGVSIERLCADETTMVRVVAICGAELFPPHGGGSAEELGL